MSGRAKQNSTSTSPAPVWRLFSPLRGHDDRRAWCRVGPPSSHVCPSPASLQTPNSVAASSFPCRVPLGPRGVTSKVAGRPWPVRSRGDVVLAGALGAPRRQLPTFAATTAIESLIVQFSRDTIGRGGGILLAARTGSSQRRRSGRGWCSPPHPPQWVRRTKAATTIAGRTALRRYAPEWGKVVTTGILLGIKYSLVLASKQLALMWQFPDEKQRSFETRIRRIGKTPGTAEARKQHVRQLFIPMLSWVGPWATMALSRL